MTAKTTTEHTADELAAAVKAAWAAYYATETDEDKAKQYVHVAAAEAACDRRRGSTLHKRRVPACPRCAAEADPEALS